MDCPHHIRCAFPFRFAVAVLTFWRNYNRYFTTELSHTILSPEDHLQAGSTHPAGRPKCLLRADPATLTNRLSAPTGRLNAPCGQAPRPLQACPKYLSFDYPCRAHFLHKKKRAADHMRLPSIFKLPYSSIQFLVFSFFNRRVQTVCTRLPRERAPYDPGLPVSFLIWLLQQKNQQ